MKHYFAPMEGLTDYIFRNIHHKYFPGADKYYTPFLSPTGDGRFTGRTLKDVLPEHNAGVTVEPQLLTKRAEDFLWAAKALADLGYQTVNLNLGCPSGTVVMKGKGSGLLADLGKLRAFLDGIFDYVQVGVSIKTRLGMTNAEEFCALLELFNRYPIEELTVHARVREDFYRLPARGEWFAYALRESKCPVCCNGDLLTVEQLNAFERQNPAAPAVMLGRGAVADPALISKAKGGHGADRETLRAWHDELYETYCTAFGHPKNALGRMKEVWFYLFCLFEEGEKLQKKLRKTTNPLEYRDLAARVFDTLPLRDTALPNW